MASPTDTPVASASHWQLALQVIGTIIILIGIGIGRLPEGKSALPYAPQRDANGVAMAPVPGVA